MAEDNGEAVVASRMFTQSDFNDLKRAQRTLHDNISNMDKAEACGIHCESMRQLSDSMSQVLAQIEAEFMTPAPTT